MTSLLVSMYEFKQFLQIVLWIALPATVLAALITTILHYRRKKKRTDVEPAYVETGFRTVMSANSDQLPDWLASSNPDNTVLLKKYEQEVRRYKENYSTLEQDFRELEGKYSELLNKAYQSEKQDDGLILRMQQEIKGYKAKVARMQQALDFKNNGNGQMDHSPVEENVSSPELQQLRETIQQLQEELKTQKEEKAREAGEMQRCFSEQLDALGKQHEQEKKEFVLQLEQAAQQHMTIEVAPAENIHDQRVQELQQLLARSEEEKVSLNNKLAGQQYLQDVLKEKKLHTEFLENQLEQRIKSYHSLEHQSAEAFAQLQTLQQAIENLEQEKNHQHDAIRSKITHIESLEFNLQELQQQQEALHSVIADKQDAIMMMQDTIAHEQRKAKELEHKLEMNSQLLVRIYTELAKSLGNGLMQSQPDMAPSILNGHLALNERLETEAFQ